jgi:hypothetical protein
VKDEALDGMQVVLRGPAHHADLWFEDGNLILVAGGAMAFKVFRGILSRHSSVFAARLVPENMSIYDGLPTLHIPECLQDVESMLYWIFDTKKCVTLPGLFLVLMLSSRIFSHTIPMVLKTVFAYYELGKTYAIHSMREEGFFRLTECYSSSLERHDLRPEGRSIIWTNLQEFQVAHFACKHELYSIAAPALYHCCMGRLSLVPGVLRSLKLDGCLPSASFLGEGLLERILEGYPHLIAARNRLIAQLMRNCVDSACKNKTTCRGYLRDLLANALRQEELQCAALEYESIALAIEKEEYVCNLCTLYSISRYKSSRLEIWDKLPTYFRLPGREGSFTSTS